MALFAIIIFALGASAAGNAYSQNTVGYTKLTIKPGFNFISAQFVPVGENEVDDITKIMDASETVIGRVTSGTMSPCGYSRSRRQPSQEDSPGTPERQDQQLGIPSGAECPAAALKR